MPTALYRFYLSLHKLMIPPLTPYLLLKVRIAKAGMNRIARISLNAKLGSTAADTQTSTLPTVPTAGVRMRYRYLRYALLPPSRRRRARRDGVGPPRTRGNAPSVALGA